MWKPSKNYLPRRLLFANFSLAEVIPLRQKKDTYLLSNNPLINFVEVFKL